MFIVSIIVANTSWRDNQTLVVEILELSTVEWRFAFPMRNAQIVLMTAMSPVPSKIYQYQTWNIWLRWETPSCLKLVAVNFLSPLCQVFFFFFSFNCLDKKAPPDQHDRSYRRTYTVRSFRGSRLYQIIFRVQNTRNPYFCLPVPYASFSESWQVDNLNGQPIQF